MSENRRRGARHAQPEQQAPQEEAAPQQHLPPPPPMTIEQIFLMQTQAVQAIGQTLAAMQQVQQQPPLPQPPVQVQMPQVPRDKWAEFMRGHPPVFAHSADPMDAEDWLCTVERELHTAQSNDREKVLYGPRQLRGATQSWWESYLATHANPEAITWEEFRDNFHRYHVPEGLMIVRKEEFFCLEAGSPVRQRVQGQVSAAIVLCPRGSQHGCQEVVPSEQPARRKSIPASEEPGSPSSYPSNQPEQSSSASSKRKSCMFPLWGTRPLGESLPKESNSTAASSQCPVR
jgi:hypothetical protein